MPKIILFASLAIRFAHAYRKYAYIKRILTITIDL